MSERERQERKEASEATANRRREVFKTGEQPSGDGDTETTEASWTDKSGGKSQKPPKGQ